MALTDSQDTTLTQQMTNVSKIAEILLIFMWDRKVILLLCLPLTVKHMSTATQREWREEKKREGYSYRLPPDGFCSLSRFGYRNHKEPQATFLALYSVFGNFLAVDRRKPSQQYKRVHPGPVQRLLLLLHWHPHALIDTELVAVLARIWDYCCCFEQGGGGGGRASVFWSCLFLS